MTERMTALLRRASEGDREAESVLISENSGLIHTIARRYFGRGAEPDDLYQLACVGFIKAVRGFDVSLGNEFSTYAVPKIAGEIRRFLRDDGAVKVSRAVKERAVRVRRLQSDWESRNGRSPTVSELAQAAGLTVEEVAACEQADVSVDSFERELSGGGRVGDLVGDEGMEERTCLHLSLHEALQDLPDRDRQVLSLRYSRDLTQQQVRRVAGAGLAHRKTRHREAEGNAERVTESRKKKRNCSGRIDIFLGLRYYNNTRRHHRVSVATMKQAMGPISVCLWSYVCGFG